MIVKTFFVFLLPWTYIMWKRLLMSASRKMARLLLEFFYSENQFSWTYFLQIQYLIKWEGYSSDDNSWERESNLFCPELIAEFKSRHKPNKSKHALKRKIDTVSIGNVLTECPLSVRFIFLFHFYRRTQKKMEVRNRKKIINLRNRKRKKRT